MKKAHGKKLLTPRQFQPPQRRIAPSVCQYEKSTRQETIDTEVDEYTQRRITPSLCPYEKSTRQGTTSTEAVPPALRRIAPSVCRIGNARSFPRNASLNWWNFSVLKRALKEQYVSKIEKIPQPAHFGLELMKLQPSSRRPVSPAAAEVCFKSRIHSHLRRLN